MLTRLEPIEDVSRELASIANLPGWRVTSVSRRPSGAAATIEKDGVVLGFSWHNADQTEFVYLRRPVHPPVALYPYRDPTVGDVLDEIGVGRDREGRLTAIADNLPTVKRYLTNSAIFRRRVLDQAEQVHGTYVLMQGKPAFADLRIALLSRHPWLDDGVPTFDALLLKTALPTKAGRRHPIAVVLFAVAFGIALARLL